MPTSGKIDNAVARCCDVDALTYVEVSSRKRRDRLRRVRLRHPVLPEAWSQGRASRGFPDFRQRRQRRHQRRWAQAGGVTLWRHITSSFLLRVIIWGCIHCETALLKRLISDVSLVLLVYFGQIGARLCTCCDWQLWLTGYAQSGRDGVNRRSGRDDSRNWPWRWRQHQLRRYMTSSARWCWQVVVVESIP